MYNWHKWLTCIYTYLAVKGSQLNVKVSMHVMMNSGIETIHTSMHLFTYNWYTIIVPCVVSTQLENGNSN